MKLKTCLGIVLLFFQTLTLCDSKPDWLIFTYIEASHQMQHEAIYNITQMAIAGVPDNVTMIVQLHTKGDNAWLLRIQEHNISVLDTVSVGPNAKDNIIETLETIIPHYPSENFGLILWDHGYGILEPTYDPTTDSWNLEPDGDYTGSCDILEKSIRHKGLLINSQYNTCLSNADMVTMATTLSNTLLGKKIDVLAMDLCLGAMIEHGYQLKDSVHYLVGSQDCELADGFDYETLMHHFHNNVITPKQLATYIVQDYGNYNKKHASIGRYTMSAIDLHDIKSIKKNVDHVADYLLSLIHKDFEYYTHLLHSTRTTCPRFCYGPSYTDLWNFYDILGEKLPDSENSLNIDNLRQTLHLGKKLIEKAVVANIAGNINKNVKGLSIYYPFVHLDSSYPTTMFAQESSWFTFLQEIIHKKETDSAAI